MLHWCSDPARLLEREDNKRACPVCQFNDYTTDKRGWRTYSCALGHNQHDGTQTSDTCPDWRLKGG